ncbi:nucleotidyltransferase [Glycomyces endophyticus]|uniref:Nucleotidyltransferase n=1 Tax=Glycomyces endophyticus TaxID=480996 RepID=A0ABP4SRV2_9ACTN
METSEIFDGLLENLKVDNSKAIADRRDEIVKALNKEFRSADGVVSYRLMVGSFGRFTATRGISDLDLLFFLPASIRGDYKDEAGPERLLRRVRRTLKDRYPRTEVRVDQCIVVVQFTDFKFEVQPVFENKDRSFSHPDTHLKRWRTTKPRAEIEAMQIRDRETSGNLRNLCRMARAWKNSHGVVMGGLLMDTLAYNFFKDATEYEKAKTSSYDLIVRDFFEFLSEEEDHEYYAALGSGQRVYVKRPFQRRAKKAYKLCLEAIEAEGKSAVNQKWKAVFGRPVPSAKSIQASQDARSFKDTEEFIEDYFPVDIRYSLRIDCRVTQNGFRPQQLSAMRKSRLPLLPQKELDFTVQDCDVPQPFQLKWKVLNRGFEAERRDDIRGQIIASSQDRTRHERSAFRGDHYVECYAIKDGVVVARDRILVPITPQG